MLLPPRDVVKNRVFTIRRLARTASTQDVVRRAARAGAADGFCVVAAEQTAGRGRQGRTWAAPSGTALLTSVLIRLSRAQAAVLPFLAGLAASDAVRETASIEPRLKWPNDVMLDGRKLAGILVELEPSSTAPAEIAAVIGLGLNIAVPSFPAGVAAVSLAAHCEAPPNAGRLLDAWLAQLDDWLATLASGGAAPVLQAWRDRAVGLGSPVRAQLPDGSIIDGVAEDVAGDGALLIRTESGTSRLVAGDVHLLHDERTT